MVLPTLDAPNKIEEGRRLSMGGKGPACRTSSPLCSSSWSSSREGGQMEGSQARQEERKLVRVAWSEKVLDSATLSLTRKYPLLEAGFHNVWWPGENTR